MTDRRDFLTAALLGAVWPVQLTASGRARRARFERDPFALGVASGYPSEHGVVLWTRLAPDPLLRGAQVADTDLLVDWELASDAEFSRIVRRGTAVAEASWGHSVHVDLDALPAGQRWFYRFRAGHHLSPVGRTWTAPTTSELPTPLQIAVMSCQHYEQGYYHAYRHALDAGVDLFVHLGDYVYENNTATPVRRHDLGECITLEDYRLRYGWYRSDPALQAAHAACPWLVTHDDHEVDNDYANLQSENPADQAGMLARRTAAYQAYYEFLPLPRSARPRGPRMSLHRTASVGELLDLHLLDTRQYRSAQPCPTPPKRGGSRVYLDTCADWLNPSRTMLGERQERWIDSALRRSRARWNLLGHGVVFTQVDEDAGPRTLHWNDSWTGYPLARRRLLESIEASGVTNPLILGGDIHAFIAADQRLEWGVADSPIVTSELVTTSVTSGPPPQNVIDAYNRPDTRDVLFADGRKRGYLQLAITPERIDAKMVGFESVRSAEAEARVLARFRLEAGTRGLRRTD